MKLLTLAIASIVDANLNQGYTQQLTHSASVQHACNNRFDIQSGLKALFNLAASTRGLVSKVSAIISERNEQRRTVRQLSGLNPHLLKDIGLHEHDLQGLKTGSITIDDINQVRLARFATRQTIKQQPVRPVRKSILDLEYANQANFDLAKCC